MRQLQRRSAIWRSFADRLDNANLAMDIRYAEVPPDVDAKLLSLDVYAPKDAKNLPASLARRGGAATPLQMRVRDDATGQGQTHDLPTPKGADANSRAAST